MGDRNNPIKFGPEWLRNLAVERTSSTTTSAGSNINNSSRGPAPAPGHPGASGASTTSGASNRVLAGAAGASGGGSASAGASGGARPSGGGGSVSSGGPASNTTAQQKILLANLRYGREEMLLLYDKDTAEMPGELRTNDTLYKLREKQPLALNNNFETEMRDMRSGPPLATLPLGDRPMARGRGLSAGDSRGRPRMPPFMRLPAGRGITYRQLFNQRLPGYPSSADDGTVPSASQRPWSNTNTHNSSGSNTGANRSSTEPSDWSFQKPTFRSKRPGTNTNWRQQQSREEDEWRASEAASSSARSRPGSNHHDKHRDWGDRSNQEKPWNTSRRQWSGDSQSNEENLPEWALGGAEACAGTFDSSGAFLGYNNEDNANKVPDTLYRSHTFGNLSRVKSAEEGSEEWWASEKANKLSPKRFDSDLKLRKKVTFQIAKPSGSENITNQQLEIGKETATNGSNLESLEELADGTSTTSTASAPAVILGQDTSYDSNFNKPLGTMMRPDMEEENDDGKFQTIMIPHTNSLRQKHQNMVQPSTGLNTNKSSGAIAKQKIRPPQSDSPPERDQPNIPAEDKQVIDKFVDSITLKDTLLSALKPGMEERSTITNSSDVGTVQGISPSVGFDQMQQGLTNRLEMMHLTCPRMINPRLPSPMSYCPRLLRSTSQPNAVLPQSVGLNNRPLSGGMSTSIGNPNTNLNTALNTGLNSGLNAGLNPGLHPGFNAGLISGLNTGMNDNLSDQGIIAKSGLSNSNLPGSSLLNPGLAPQGMPMSNRPKPTLEHSNMNVGLQNTLKGALDFPNRPSHNNMGLGMSLPSSLVTPQSLLPGYQANNGLPGMANADHNKSLFLGQNLGNVSLQPNTDPQMLNQQQNMYPLHGLPHSGNQTCYGSSLYSVPPPTPPANAPNLVDQWYYEDPEKIIQGPFSSREMYNWYRAGFFNSGLMVRRACDTQMRPLGSYGPVVPFQMVLNMNEMNSSNMEPLQFGSVGMMYNQAYGQPQNMESLWSSQGGMSSDIAWMDQAMNRRTEPNVNNLSMYLWEQQEPSTITPKSLLPEDITKGMKTEDQILAQLRATQNLNPATNAGFIKDLPSTTTPCSLSEVPLPFIPTTPDMEELHKLIQKESSPPTPTATETSISLQDIPEPPPDSVVKSELLTIPDPEPTNEPTESVQPLPAASSNKTVEQKSAKPKNEAEKGNKNKENISTKNKTKKTKEEKKEEIEPKSKGEDNVKVAEKKRSAESSPVKSKKEEKVTKKELEKEKKEWIRDGFTIIRGSEKYVKDSKKKNDDKDITEEYDRKRKEEEQLTAEDEKRRKHLESFKKPQEAVQRKTESNRKAPWSAISGQAKALNENEGLTLTEIQRLEREKKLEQMKEQQQMMQIIAQQQAAALAREQELQASLGWAKKATASAAPRQSLVEIQAETRKQALSQAAEEARAPSPAPAADHAPWGNTHNGVGFWDTELAKTEKGEPPKSVEQNKPKKKTTQYVSAKKDASPGAEFEAWCNTALATWSTKIDVPTFVGFLKDVESPYEVKGYVKYYLGETKESGDFGRQFLEKRSKLLRVGTVTPSDDLCSPAVAVNPRASTSDYQEVKGKAKKSKKNKMLKVDARILGFSVTASEDRINVGDIDTV